MLQNYYLRPMAAKTFLNQLKERLNISQKELGELFQSSRSAISHVESGSRSLNSKQLEVLKVLMIESWRRPVVGEKVLPERDDQTKAKLRGYADDLRIALHHAKRKLQDLQAKYEADTQALVWLQIMKEAVELRPKPDQRILMWIAAQVAAKQLALKKCSLDKQAIVAARIAGLEAELRFIRNVGAKKKVTIKKMMVS